MSTPGWLGRATLDHLVSWRTRIWATLLAIVAAILCTLPLFGVLGFEFCLAMAVAGSISGADLGASLIARARTMNSTRLSRTLPPGRVVFDSLKGAALISTLILLPPLIIVSLAGIWVRNCD